MSYDLIFALIGFVIMFVILRSIGMTNPRGMSIKMWCAGYLSIAIVFDIIAVFGLIAQSTLFLDLLVGLSAGAATGLAIHVQHDMNEEHEH